MCLCFYFETVSATVKARITQSNIIDRQSVCSVSAMCCRVTSVGELTLVIFNTDIVIEIRNILLIGPANAARISVTSKRCR